MNGCYYNKDICLHCESGEPSYCEKCYQELIGINAKLQEENKTLTDEYMIQKHLINANFLDDYIPKSKAREKIIEIKNKPVKDDFITASQGKLDTIIAIEQLLEE